MNVAVTIDVPALPTSNLVPEMTTTEVSADMYDHVPVAAVVATTGETIVMSGSLNVAVASDHENVGVALSTVSVALVVAVVKLTESVGENVAAEKISSIDALSLRFDTTYSLEPEELPSGLKKELDSGSIFKFPFNPRADYQVETGILVGNENGYFALIGQEVEYQYSALSSVVSVVDEAASDSSDDLDFEMF